MITSQLSTSRIRYGYQNPETGQITSSFAKYDGYSDDRGAGFETTAGRRLITNFGNWDVVRDYVNLGDQELLDGLPSPGNTSPKTSETLEEFLQLARDCNCEYAYLVRANLNPFYKVYRSSGLEYFIELEVYDTSTTTTAATKIEAGQDKPKGKE